MSQAATSTQSKADSFDEPINPNFAETTSGVSGGEGRGLSFGGVRWVIVAVLVVAALLKGYSLATGPVVGGTWIDTRAFQILTVEFELLFAGLLATGLMLRQMRWACIGLFLVFAGVAGYKLWLGESSCGCFGRVSISPIWTLLLDLGLAVLAFVSSTASTPAPATQLRSKTAPVLAGVLGYSFLAIPLTYAMLTYAPGTLAAGDGNTARGGWVIDAEEGDFVLLEPTQWIGQTFPLFGQIDGIEPVQTGDWTLVLFRSDCPHCQEVVPGMVREAQAVGGQMALVEMPPFASPSGVWWPTSGQGLWVGKISDRYDWFIQSPGVVDLSDGVVTAASEGGH